MNNEKQQTVKNRTSMNGTMLFSTAAGHATAKVGYIRGLPVPSAPHHRHEVLSSNNISPQQ